jgi:hypothetical protein
VRDHHSEETIMTNMDPQTTADFWDAYVTAADADRLASSPHDDQ